MLLFIAAPIVSVVLQSLHTPHGAVLVEAETCTPLFGCILETTIDQEATRELREAGPLARLVGLDMYLERANLAFAEGAEAWRQSDDLGEFWTSLMNLTF